MLRRALLPASLAAVVLAAGCGSDDGATSTRTSPARARIDLDHGAFKGVLLNSSKRHVIDRLGAPRPADLGGTLFYDNVYFVLEDRRVRQVATGGDSIDDPVESTRGLRIGDPMSRAAELYPELDCGVRPGYSEGPLGDGGTADTAGCKGRIGQVHVFVEADASKDETPVTGMLAGRVARRPG